MNKRKINELFGKRLQTLRLQKGITPSQFYDASGIDEYTLLQYENGELEPQLTTIAVMSKALGVSHVELMNIDINDIDL
jgi:transcriptional regulator with XRE-family HTH domain